MRMQGYFTALLLAGAFFGASVPFVLAQELSTKPQVTPPYDINVTIPGEGYQGGAYPYGGLGDDGQEKVLQYCYINRLIGDPKAPNTLYFEFKACDPDNKPLTAYINWGDGYQTIVERVTCGRWRVPHRYAAPGDYTANILINSETCAGKCQEKPPSCTFWKPQNQRCYPGEAPDPAAIICISADYNCINLSLVEACTWNVGGTVSNQKPCRFEEVSINLPRGATVGPQSKIANTLKRTDGSTVSANCTFAAGPPAGNLELADDQSPGDFTELFNATVIETDEAGVLIVAKPSGPTKKIVRAQDELVLEARASQGINAFWPVMLGVVAGLGLLFGGILYVRNKLGKI